MINIMPTVDQESNDLDLHVQLCAQRYMELDERLGKLEVKVDGIANKIDTFKTEIAKIMLTTAGTIIVALIGCAGVVVTHFK